MIQFAYTILYVSDVKKSVDFYAGAFGFEVKFIAPGDDYAELLTGNTTLSFASHSLANSNLAAGFQESKPGSKPFGMELGFATPDVEAAVNSALAQGASLVEKPKEKPWGQVVAYVRDPDGFLIELCTPMN